MSRETAPNYRVVESCFHCVESFIGIFDLHGRTRDRCLKHEFEFPGEESRSRKCDDFKLFGDTEVPKEENE